MPCLWIHRKLCKILTHTLGMVIWQTLISTSTCISLLSPPPPYEVRTPSHIQNNETQTSGSDVSTSNVLKIQMVYYIQLLQLSVVFWVGGHKSSTFAIILALCVCVVVVVWIVYYSLSSSGFEFLVLLHPTLGLQCEQPHWALYSFWSTKYLLHCLFC